MSPLQKLYTLIARLKPGGGTAERAAKSGVWLGSQNILSRVLQLTTLALLARLIGPRELGFVGIALLTLSALKKFTNMGMNTALIQKKEQNVDTHLNTAWTIGIVRGVVIAGVLYLSAPLIANLVFNEPRAAGLMQVMAISPLILGFRNPGIVYFQKSLKFHKQFVYRISGDLTQLIVAVGWALNSATALAFVLGFVASDVVRFFISFILHPHRPWPEFDSGIARELVNYGKWMTGSSILYFLYGEGDDAFVGWLLGPTALAYYQYTYRFSSAPATELSQVVNSVMFPAFSQLQKDTDKLKDAFLKTLRLNSLIAFPASVGIAVIAPAFILVVFGEEWLPAVPAMQVLAVYGLFRAIGRTFSPVWKTLGRPDLITKLSALRFVLMAILIYPLTVEYGIVGTAITVTAIYIFPMMPLDIVVTAQLIDIPSRDIVYEFVFPLFGSVTMGLSLWYVSNTLTVRPLFELVLLIPLGVVLYAGAVILFETMFEWNVRDQFKRIAENIAP
ncbi:lipopolysaccharide biosynthesis protein [Salinigranum halophilum]|uniref:lipopolysaccharide biosynthesis protein n=1 Tax=Salinigranum halophilum TaxID=2565931 RepID=UPI0010A75F0B|nr:lipopolysaccharide biosynthesis protein [Salinigranum halophilum]